MYEFHGWVHLFENPDEDGYGQKCERLRLRLEELQWPSGIAQILLQNGLTTLILHGRPPRRRSESDEIEDILNTVIADFKDAYGLIYEYDETSVQNGYGVFSVKVIKRGAYETRLDPFLSPIIPVVEDVSS